MSLPKSFRDDKEFLEYILLHSQNLRALFSTEQVGYLYELAGEKIPFGYTSTTNLMTLPHDEPTTRKLLDKAKENVYGKPDEKVVCLDDYR